jgi:hypothetical protein
VDIEKGFCFQNSAADILFRNLFAVQPNQFNESNLIEEFVTHNKLAEGTMAEP